jgi:hypothetical protein
MKRSPHLLALSTLACACVIATPLLTQTRAEAAPLTAITQAKPSSDQTPPPPPPSSQLPAMSQNRNVQVEVTVTLQGGSTPASKKMTLVAVENTMALGRSGIEVPIPSATSIGAGAAGVTPIQSYNYRSVGLNVDARPRILESGRIQLMFKLEFSAVLKPEGSGPQMPAFSKGNTELNLVLESGKPLTITQSADAEIGRGYSVELKATLLK